MLANWSSVSSVIVDRTVRTASASPRSRIATSMGISEAFVAAEIASAENMIDANAIRNASAASPSPK